MHPELPYRLLIGPLYNPAVIGKYAQSEQIRLFMPRSALTERYAYDLVYDRHEIQNFNDILKGLPSDWEPDLVIWWDPVYQSLPPGVEDCPYPTALIPGDWNLAYLTILQLSKAFDLVFADGRLGPILRKEGIQNIYPWIGFAYDAQKIFPDPEPEYRYDVSFIGNLNPAIHPVRSRYLDQLLSLKKEYRIHLACNVWGDAYRKVMAQSRIVFNYTICQVLNMRAFEAPAAGALLMIEDSNVEVRDVFDENACVLYNQDNLVEQVRTILSNESRRYAMAARGHEIAQSYSYERHFERLLAQIAQLDLTQFPSQRQVLDQTSEVRKLRALNICSASSASGASQVEAELKHIRNQFLKGFGTEDLWRLNALMAMVFPYLDEEEQMHFVYDLSLSELANWFEFAMRLAPKHPVLLYHYAFILEYQGRHEHALKYYSHAFEEFTYGERAVLLDYREFIVPFNKAGRGTHTLAFEWERLSYECIEQEKELLDPYYLLMCAQIWQCIGRVLTRLKQYEKAITAYEHAYTNHAIPEFLLRQAEIYHQQGDSSQALKLFEKTLNIQPFYIQYLPGLLNADLIIEFAERLELWISRYVDVFPEQLKNGSLLLEMIAVAQKRKTPPSTAYWNDAFQQARFDSVFFQNLTRILQHFQSVPELAALQVLRMPFEIRWDLAFESPPQFDLSDGFIWSSHATVSIGESTQHSWQRVYGEIKKDPLTLDLERFSYLYPQVSAICSEEVTSIFQEKSQRFLFILDGARRTELQSQFEALTQESLREECIVILWSPGRSWQLSELESLLPEDLAFDLAWLDTELNAAEQLHLLQQVDAVLAAPYGLGHYFGCWAQNQQSPVVWLSKPLAELEQLQGFQSELFDSWSILFDRPACQPVTRSDEIQRKQLEQAWQQGLWQFRLLHQLGDN